MPVAITRDVSANLAECQLSFVARDHIDLDLARSQHAAYCGALAALGCEVRRLPALNALADAVFVEDVALVLDEVAVMTRPGAASRRAEVEPMADVLAAYRPLLRIEAPGTVDGGDIVRLGRDVYVGQAARSNADGVAQLARMLLPFGYRVHAVTTHGCLHLKSAVTVVADDTLLVQPAWVDIAGFSNHRLLEVDPSEGHAANAVRIGDAVIHPSCFPRTHERLRQAGISVHAVDVSELQKAEGAVTCCSLVFER
ncbi:MAG: dimethylargininase [Luteimonas sp.]